MPEAPIKEETKVSKKIKENDKRAETIMKENAEKRLKESKENLNIGDVVLSKQNKIDKFSTPFNPKPYEIVDVKGTMITAKRGEKKITRNCNFNRVNIPKNEVKA